jgi:lipooligosaccharide transport system permease protein
MVATPLRPLDIVLGQLGFIAFRVLTTCAVFLGMLAVFGAIDSRLGVFSLGVALLVGLAYAAPVFAIATRLENDWGFALVFRLGLLPMFLFSGVFFPVTQLPDGVEWLAYLTPLWHGVALSRDLSLGSVPLGPAAGHLAYIAVWAVAGTWLALRGLTRRLIR